MSNTFLDTEKYSSEEEQTKKIPPRSGEGMGEGGKHGSGGRGS